MFQMCSFKKIMSLSSMSLSPIIYLSSPSSNLPFCHCKGSMEEQSSQDSCWTSYTNGCSLSAQSSQEELPSMLMPMKDCPQSSRLMVLDTTAERHKPLQFKCVSRVEIYRLKSLQMSFLYVVVLVFGALIIHFWQWQR